MIDLEKRIQTLEERLELTDKRLQLVLSILNNNLSKEENAAAPVYEPIKPSYDLAKEMDNRGINYSTEELNALQSIVKRYKDEQVSFVLTKVAAQSKKTKINNLIGYIKRSLDIEAGAVRYG